MFNTVYERLIERILKLEQRADTQDKVIEYLKNKLINLENDVYQEEEQPVYLGMKKG